MNLIISYVRLLDSTCVASSTVLRRPMSRAWSGMTLCVHEIQWTYSNSWPELVRATQVLTDASLLGSSRTPSRLITRPHRLIVVRKSSSFTETLKLRSKQIQKKVPRFAINVCSVPLWRAKSSIQTFKRSLNSLKRGVSLIWKFWA